MRKETSTLNKIRSKKTAALVAALALTALVAGLARRRYPEGRTSGSPSTEASPRMSCRGARRLRSRSRSRPTSTTGEGEPPKLLRISLAINRNGHIDYKGLPKCHYKRIQPSNNREALEACGASRVGTGLLGERPAARTVAVPLAGKIFAFNGEVLGHPVIFAHIYGTKPVPTSFVLPFVVRTRTGSTRRRWSPIFRK